MTKYVSIEIYSLQGKINEYYLKTDSLCKIHKWNFWQGCSFGGGSDYRQYKFIIDNSAWYKSAPLGSKPIYYVVYENQNYFYVDYWYYFGMDDLRYLNQSKQGAYHESDWEHVTLQLSKSNNINMIIPLKVNSYRHEGGRTFLANDCWWSTSRNDTTYSSSKLKQGYDENHTHLHVWLAANSHASYNRFSEVYHLIINSRTGLNYHNEDNIQDNVDYYPEGYDLYFTYDSLVNFGNDIKLFRFKKFHGYKYFFHYDTIGNSTKIWLCYPQPLGSDFLEINRNYGVYHYIYKYPIPLMPTFQVDSWKKFPENFSKRGFGNNETSKNIIIASGNTQILYEKDINSSLGGG